MHQKKKKVDHHMLLDIFNFLLHFTVFCFRATSSGQGNRTEFKYRTFTDEFRFEPYLLGCQVVVVVSIQDKQTQINKHPSYEPRLISTIPFRGKTTISIYYPRLSNFHCYFTPPPPPPLKFIINPEMIPRPRPHLPLTEF